MAPRWRFPPPWARPPRCRRPPRPPRRWRGRTRCGSRSRPCTCPPRSCGSGVAANGSVQVPPLDNHDLTGWYDRSVTPGQRGSSVILGHVNSFTGISVFFSIKTLHPGNKIDIVRANGSTAVFTVDGVQKLVKATFPASEVYGNVSFPSLRLVTCGGPFDTTTRQYLDNVVVYAHLIRGSR